MKNCALVLIMFLLSSCCKARLEMVTLLNNTTDDKIELKFYYKGVVFTSTIIDAKSTTTGSSWLAFTPASIVDSVQILVDDKYQQTHNYLNISKPADSAKVVGFREPGNLFYIKSYQETKEEINTYCGGNITTYTYTFK